MKAALRPYHAAFAARFQLTLQYRAAAVAGFATQCWWGATKVLIYTAFFQHTIRETSGGHTPITLAQSITYTWLAQALLSLIPWSGDPEVAAKVRSGAVSYDRLRPLDAYGWWYVNSAAWMTARAVPRAALMFLLTGVVFPMVGLHAWAWLLPPDIHAAGLFALSMVLMVLLSSSLVMLINICIAATLTDRGINNLVTPFVMVLTGNLLPLPLFPDWARTLLFVQPFAGVMDIPFRIYCGELVGIRAWLGLGLQLFWFTTLVVVGRLWMGRVMARMQVQGG